MAMIMHLYMLFVRICVLLLVALMDLYIFIVGGVGFVCMCGLVIDWVRFCFWVSVLACVYVCFVWFCALCVLWLMMTHWLLMRTL